YTDPFGLCQEEDKKHGNCTQADVGTEDITGVNGQAVRQIAVAEGRVTGVALGGAIITAGVAAGPLAVADASAISVTTGLAGTGVRYLGQEEAALVQQNRMIPATNAAGEPRAIHFTADAPMTSASEAAARYGL